jgi:hypothetical protein
MRADMLDDLPCLRRLKSSHWGLAGHTADHGLWLAQVRPDHRREVGLQKELLCVREQHLRNDKIGLSCTTVPDFMSRRLRCLRATVLIA